MTQEQKNTIAYTIALTARYYSHPIDREVIQMIVGDLEDLDFDAVQAAYRKYRLNGKNNRFPFAGQIRDLVMPEPSEEVLARELTAKISEAVKRFGWTNATAAKEFIGDVGWSVVKSYGGWQSICEGLGLEFSVDTFNAQARELIKGRIKHGTEIADKATAIEFKPKGEALVVESGGEKRGVLAVLNISAKELP